jgi:hypothetical protein
MVKVRQLVVVRAAAAALVTLGAALVALSAFYVSSFLAILGLAMVFWGCILLYVSPVKHVPYDLLEAAADVNASGIERVLAELNLSGKGVYLPPKNLKDIDSSLVFIPLPPAVVEAQVAQEPALVPSEEAAAVSPYEVSLEAVPLTAPAAEPVPELPEPAPEAPAPEQELVAEEAEVPVEVEKVSLVVEPVEAVKPEVSVVAEAVRVVEVEKVSAASVAVLPGGVVRPPSVRYAPSGKSVFETGFASVFDGGVDVVGDSLVGKWVRSRVEGDVGCVVRRRDTGLGSLVLVEFKWDTVQERGVHGGLAGEAVWFWLDEVEEVKPESAEDLAMLVEDVLDDLDSIGAAALKELEEL